MLENLFGNKIIEKICFYLCANQKCYASELKRQFKRPLFSIQNALSKLEIQGILVSFMVGKTRVYQWNPRYPFLKEFQAFISKIYSCIPKEIKEQYYEPVVRKRPRRAGKPL